MATVTVNFNPTSVLNASNITDNGGVAINDGDSVPDSIAYNFNGTGTSTDQAFLQFTVTPAQSIPLNATIKSIQFNYLIVPIDTVEDFLDNSQFQGKIGVFSNTGAFSGFYIEDDNFNINLDGSADGFQLQNSHTINEDNSFSTSTEQAEIIQQLAGGQASLLMFFALEDNNSPAEQVQLSRIQFNPSTSFNTPVFKITYEFQPHKILITNNTKVKLQNSPVKAKLI